MLERGCDGPLSSRRTGRNRRARRSEERLRRHRRQLEPDRRRHQKKWPTPVDSRAPRRGRRLRRRSGGPIDRATGNVRRISGPGSRASAERSLRRESEPGTGVCTRIARRKQRRGQRLLPRNRSRAHVSGGVCVLRPPHHESPSAASLRNGVPTGNCESRASRSWRSRAIPRGSTRGSTRCFPTISRCRPPPTRPHRLPSTRSLA